MISNYLSSIDGVSIYPVISLILFFSFFVFMIIKVVKMDKGYIKKMGRLPLGTYNENNSETENEINQ
jgi:hypothetical protein